MKFHHLLFSTLAASLLISPVDALAKKGAPHTFSAEPNYSTVKLSWLKPAEAKELKWHDNVDYDGDAGTQTSSQSPAVIYVASDFDIADLQMVKGEKITSLNYFEYRPTVKVTAIIWEDGKIVRQQDADLHSPEFKANQWRTVSFDNPYEITADKKIRIGFRIEHGSNLDFVAIMNKVANSKGDLRSYDGVNWVHNGRGTYLVTANLFNDTDENPTGYYVWIDGEKATSSPRFVPGYTATNQSDGTHTYKIEAKYSSGESFFSPEATVTIKGADSFFPSVAGAKASTDAMIGKISWEAPLLRTGNELTWSNKTLNQSIGGTASSNTKVWIKNEFSATDLLEFKGAKITAINAHFSEATVSAVTIWVMKDGEFVCHEAMSADAVAKIAEKQWTKFSFSNPVEIEPGHSYTYGYYILHTPKTHPVSTDSTSPMGSKSNSFSTSSPNSTDFAKSKPSWKTLASGNLSGGWMMTADIEGGSLTDTSIAGYNIYRDGEKVADKVNKTEFDDEVPAPGTYTYAIETVAANGKSSSLFNVKATYRLPDSYRAPMIGSSKVDKEAKTIDFNWSMDVEMKHYGAATYKVGFDEDMMLSYGTRFSAAELADYEGYSIKAINFILGEKIEGGFKLEIFNSAGKAIASQQFPADVAEPLMMYSFPLDNPVTISGKEDLYLAYTATLKGGTSPIVLDAGPVVDGGAMVKLPGMSSWLNLGTINSTYNNYNIVIGAVVSEPEGQAASAINIPVAAYASKLPAISSREAGKGFGIDGGAKAVAPAPRALKPARYKIYRNGQFMATTSHQTYSDQFPGYDTYSYTVSAVYPNGWESPVSDPLIIENNIKQAGPAPYDLSGDGKTLSWKAPETAPVLTYAIDGKSYGVGMTGNGTRETYAVQKFEPESLKDVNGKLISHIKFALYSTDIYTASVVVFKDLNIIYEQEVSVDDLCVLADGYNNIRLNKPVAIDASSTYMIGYHITYANGVKPMIFDEGPATDGFGNLISASASHTSWKSLKSLSSSLNGNWRIYAILANPASSTIRNKATGVTYNIYLDGKQFKTGIAQQSYTHSENLPEGDYTVTAVAGESESAHSNVYTVALDGIDEITGDATNVRYDAESQTIVAPEGQQAAIFNANGQKVARTVGSASVANLASGVYFYVTAQGKALRFIK